MKLVVFLLAAAAALAGDLSQTRTVYILPMASGLDQYLANRLTQAHVLQVVTDPAKADAVISDRVGAGFEQKMTELYPPPEPPKTESPKKADAAKTDAAKTETDQSRSMLGMGDTVNKLSNPVSTFGGGKGTIFLVSVKSRDVLWSTYERPKDNRAAQLEKTAAKICEDLKKSISGK